MIHVHGNGQHGRFSTSLLDYVIVKHVPFYCILLIWYYRGQRTVWHSTWDYEWVRVHSMFGLLQAVCYAGAGSNTPDGRQTESYRSVFNNNWEDGKILERECGSGSRKEVFRAVQPLLGVSQYLEPSSLQKTLICNIYSQRVCMPSVLWSQCTIVIWEFTSSWNIASYLSFRSLSTSLRLPKCSRKPFLAQIMVILHACNAWLVSMGEKFPLIRLHKNGNLPHFSAWPTTQYWWTAKFAGRARLPVCWYAVRIHFWIYWQSDKIIGWPNDDGINTLYSKMFGDVRSDRALIDEYIVCLKQDSRESDTRNVVLFNGHIESGLYTIEFYVLGHPYEHSAKSCHISILSGAPYELCNVALNTKKKNVSDEKSNQNKGDSRLFESSAEEAEQVKHYC